VRLSPQQLEELQAFYTTVNWNVTKLINEHFEYHTLTRGDSDERMLEAELLRQLRLLRAQAVMSHRFAEAVSAYERRHREDEP
jgi:hypothetical protein